MVASTMGVFLAMLVGVGAGQNQSGSVSGMITDTSGFGLPGASIAVVSDSGARHATVTDSAGRYRLDDLPPGRYLIKVSMSGFVAKTIAATVTPGSNAVSSGALLVGHAADEISIERKVVGLAGPEAFDCGRHSAPTSEATLRQSMECGLTSARARRPFSVIVQFGGSASQTGQGLLAGSDGIVYLFEYDRGGATFSSQECPSPDVTRGRSGAKFEFTCRPLR
jgi:hypothetical protein